jgi:hypothetical protein
VKRLVTIQTNSNKNNYSDSYFTFNLFNIKIDEINLKIISIPTNCSEIWNKLINLLPLQQNREEFFLEPKGI